MRRFRWAALGPDTAPKPAYPVPTRRLTSGSAPSTPRRSAFRQRSQETGFARRPSDSLRKLAIQGRGVGSLIAYRSSIGQTKAVSSHGCTKGSSVACRSFFQDPSSR